MSLRNGRPLRVFHVPALVGDHGPSLASLERQAGLRSECVAEMPHAFGFSADVALWHPGEPPVLMELRRLALFARIVVCADVVHYNWGRTLFPDLRPRPSPAERGRPSWMRHAYRAYGRWMAELELRLLRQRGVRIVVTFQGNDARQMDRCRASGAWRAADAMAANGCTADEDEWKRRVIARCGRFAHAIFALNPDLCRVLPPRARFLPYLHWDHRRAQRAVHSGRDEMVVAHAPSVRAQKGTEAVVSAIGRLQAAGVPLRLELIEGMCHRECLQVMAGADVFVDQLLYGWYGGAAVEAMSFGLPTVAFIDDRDLAYVPKTMARELPVVSATPETIADRLLELYHMGPERRNALGSASRVFVERWHDPSVVAKVVMRAYEPTALGQGASADAD